MDHIVLAVNSITHILSVSTDSPLTQIDQNYTDVTVTLPEGFEDHSVRLDFEIAIRDANGRNYYPYKYMDKDTEGDLIPYVIPTGLLLACIGGKLPIRVFLKSGDVGFATVNTINIPISFAISAEAGIGDWSNTDYEKAFVKAEFDEDSQIVTLTSVDKSTFIFPVIRHVFEQTSPSATWTITHNLGRDVQVETIDTSGTTMVGEISRPSVNQVVVTFNGATAGKAIVI
jgi:hypothetical protein